MSNKKIIAVVTGTRAEFGLLLPVIRQLESSSALEPHVIVTGAHLSAAYGNTVKEIEKSGVRIAAKIDILKFGTGQLSTAHTVAYAIDEFSKYFAVHRPDMVLVLGDRYEIFAVGTAAALSSIPIAHISGGDVTKGAADEYFRHCLTKMASIHFPSCDEYARRVIAMGEAPSTVHNVGGLGDENLRSVQTFTRSRLEASLGFSLREPFALVTFHPETAGDGDPEKQFNELLKALDGSGLNCIFTKSNADAGGSEINALIDEAVSQNSAKYVAFTSLGLVRYLSAMKLCSVVIGNSSSGVVETPTLGVPAINIGSRQSGRIMCRNVICTRADADEISQAIQKALSPQFISEAHKTVSPYNGGETSKHIVEWLEKYARSEEFGKPKEFYDIK